MKHKLIKRFLIFIILGTVAAGGICGGMYARKNSLKAEVVPVELLGSGYWGDEVSSSGVVSNDYFQEVKLDQNAQIKEVCVEEGQEVHAGDKLLILDVSGEQLNYQIKALEVEKLQNKIDIAVNELKILKNTKPYEPSAVPEAVMETEQITDNGEAQVSETDQAAAKAGGSETGKLSEDVSPGYTREELKQMITDKEREISELDLSRRKAELEAEKLKQKQTDGVIYAAVDGTVKNLQNKDQLPVDSTPFLTVAGTGGLYVTGSVSEFLLDQIQPGQRVTVSSWESGITCEAVIREIGTYPTAAGGYGEGNANVSYYPYTAYIENENGGELRNGESVDLNMTVGGNENPESVYLSKMYVRTENGRSYVMKADNNNRLVKQFIQTGRIINGDTIEILSGLSTEDRVAFPYGKAAREGTRAVDSEESGV